MTSVLYSSGGYNLGGNQFRVEIRNLTNRVDTLTTSLTSLKDLFVSLHPDKTDEINATLSNVLNPTTNSTPANAPPPPFPPRNPAQNAAVNRVRP